jgi:Uma2 family endonuclease
VTSAEYFETPETVLPAELAYGELRVAEAPSVYHQRTVGELFVSLTEHVRARRLGEVLIAPTDVVLDYEAGLIVQPDVIFVSNERSQIVGTRVNGAPDLVIEVVSPQPRVGKLDERIGWFCRYGVRECWLVDQREDRIAVLTLGAGGVEHRFLCPFGGPVRSAVLPDFRTAAAQ